MTEKWFNAITLLEGLLSDLREANPDINTSAIGYMNADEAEEIFDLFYNPDTSEPLVKRFGIAFAEQVMVAYSSLSMYEHAGRLKKAIDIARTETIRESFA